MPNWITFNKKLKKFNETISVSGDKSKYKMGTTCFFGNGISTAKNLLLSEDVYAAIKAIKSLGVKVSLKK